MLFKNLCELHSGCQIDNCGRRHGLCQCSLSIKKLSNHRRGLTTSSQQHSLDMAESYALQTAVLSDLKVKLDVTKLV
jgi:hypothetical protein